jgi:uncharacterized protein (DUF1684 family)
MAIEVLSLADWRRRVAGLYADVRFLAEASPEQAWRHWVETREVLFRTHTQSPVPEPDRPDFRAHHWPYDPALRFGAVAVKREPWPESGPDPDNPQARSLKLPNSGGETLGFRRIGTLTIPFPIGERTLSLFWMEGYAGGLFLPFRDATSGVETYGAGRYLLDAAKSADLGADLGDCDQPGTLVLDFNFAYQPSCAFDPKWACPLAPPENQLDIAIRAGERMT